MVLRAQHRAVHNCRMLTEIRLVAALVGASFSLSVHAWGAEVHQLIGQLAESQLSPTAKAEVHRLLALEPGATMASVATWADEMRSPATAPWHYVNPSPDDCSYEPARDCEGGKCVVDALDRQIALLSSNESDERRLVALKWVIHLVGDVHQPLHAGFKEDKGGNLYQVQAFGRGTNLHSLWDGGLIRNRPGGMDALRASASTAGVASAAPARPPAWAVESCKIVSSPGFYPEGRFIEQGYLAQWDPVLVGRLKSAGQRLAATLNHALR